MYQRLVLGDPSLFKRAEPIIDFDDRADLQRIVARGDLGGFPRRNQSVDCTGLFVVCEQCLDWAIEVGGK